MPPTQTLTGLTGRAYEYQTCLMEGNWSDVPGGYAFLASRPGIGQTSVCRILYIGQTDSLQRRMGEHRKDVWQEAVRLGATHVLAHVNLNGEAARLAEEEDLIRRYNPLLNTQHRKHPLGGMYALGAEFAARPSGLGLLTPRGT